MSSRTVLASWLTGLVALAGATTCADVQEDGAATGADPIAVAGPAAGPADRRAGAAGWVGTWASAPQALGQISLASVTLRQIVHVSAGGREVRVRLDNTFGDGPLVLADVHVALQEVDASIAPDTDRAVTFAGAASVTVAQGAIALGDPVELAVPAQSNVAVSMFLPGVSPQLTGHTSAGQTSYVSTAGDHAAEPGGAAFTGQLFDWYWLSGLDVRGAPVRGAIAALGDSITNGSNSGFGQNHRWPDILAGRLLAAGDAAPRSVLNEGIGGAQLLTRRTDCCPTAEAGLARLARDVIAQAGVTHAVVLVGVNDIGFGAGAPSLIAGFQQLAAQLHARGIAVVGATILPFGGSIVDSPEHEATRQAVNAWIRTGGQAFDGFIDFDQAVRDPASPTRLRPELDSGDHLHPGDAGHIAMGNAVDLSLFR
jgi:lysophospholipase L1-like esterase